MPPRRLLQPHGSRPLTRSTPAADNDQLARAEPPTEQQLQQQLQIQSQEAILTPAAGSSSGEPEIQEQRPPETAQRVPEPKIIKGKQAVRRLFPPYADFGPNSLQELQLTTRFP